jgi:SAM-dependent methyltransferase
MNPDPQKFTDQNRRAWNEIAEVRSKVFPPAAFFAQGGCTLSPRLIEAAQLSPAQTLLHLQCATGEDTLSWAGLGAEAYGVDISDIQAEIANQKARDAGLGARFAAADIYDLALSGAPGVPDALPADWPAQYDRVFTGGGALVWLPDITRWAQIVAGLLKPGGRLVLEDIHPISGILWVEDGQIQLAGDYFGRGKTEAETGWSHFKGGEHAKEVKYEFNWPLGDIVTALARAGLVIERLEEFPGGPEYRFKDKQDESMRLPGDFLLAARK